MRIFKYFSPFVIYLGAWRAFTVTGWEIWLPLIYAWLIVPLVELFIAPDASNMSAAEEDLARSNHLYDALLYFVVLLQYLSLGLFLYAMVNDKMSLIDITGRIWVMGLLCGVFGINVGHELGHRPNKAEQFLAKALLLTSQYMHFFIEHNKGHHKRVATREDPSSARKNEPVYSFYARSVIFSYLSAWHIAGIDVRKKGGHALSIKNQMVRFTLVQLAFITIIVSLTGWLVTVFYLAAAGIGILLLETVNYIEHYGLQRQRGSDGKYERAMPAHSWNSDHVIGRVMLFELSRHSDHHYLASRKYQVLRHHDNAPQMPTGYPGMMLLSLVPPAWFYIMNRRIHDYRQASLRTSE